MSKFEWSDLALLKPHFVAALCPDEIGFSVDGYLTPCFTNTYLYSPLAIILTIWAVTETKTLNTNGHRTNTVGNAVNFLLTILYTIVTIAKGPDMFNVISTPVNLLTNFVIFVLAFFDFKGVNVPNKPIEIYYFLTAAVSGYLVVQGIGMKNFTSQLLAPTYICLASSAAGSARNIISAFTDAEREAVKKN